MATERYHIQATDPNLLRAMELAAAQGRLTIDPVRLSGSRLAYGRVWTNAKATPKHYNQAAKARRRQAQGKPSYRQRQASARAAKAQRQSPVPA